MGYTWGMATHANERRLWVAKFLHARIKAIKKRTGKPMLQVANELIRDGLRVESGVREAERLIRARRDGRQE